MSDFFPTNSIEIELRKILRDKNSPLWNFYTPLAAVNLWVFADHCPEFMITEEPAPAGTNPRMCVFSCPGKTSYIGVYTAYSRAEAAFKKLNLSDELTIIEAKGYPLLEFLSGYDADLLINLGLPECQYYLDSDMVKILLQRPEPEFQPEAASPRQLFESAPEAEAHLGPLRDFLASQPGVRAAWIMKEHTEDSSATRSGAYQVGLLLRDPDDDSVLEKASQIAKAVTPVEMEWEDGMALIAEEDSLRQWAEQSPPFYQASDFLAG